MNLRDLFKQRVKEESNRFKKRLQRKRAPVFVSDAVESVKPPKDLVYEFKPSRLVK
jgi:hypothetical protein